MKYITKAGCNFEIDYGANLSRYTAKPENKTPYYRNFTTQLCLSIPELLSFFDVFGIDIIKPDSLVWNDEGEKLRYTAEYRCKGSIGDPGFTRPMVSELWTRLGTFFKTEVPQEPLKREFYLPSAVNGQLEEGTARVRVLPCEEVWHGVTYREDLASVKEAICALKEVVDLAKRRAPVKIIGIDDRKRPVQHVPAAGHGLSRAPRLDAALRHGAAVRNVRQLLVDVFHVEKPLHAVPDALAEECVVLALDDKNKIAEARASCVVHGKIDDAVPLPVDRLHLLEPAEAAAHSGCHNDELRRLFLHMHASCKLLCLYGIGSAVRLQALFAGNFLPTRTACRTRPVVIHCIKSMLNRR